MTLALPPVKAVMTVPLTQVVMSTLPKRAETLFEVIQDRHLPMTPRLALLLADFEAATAPASEPFWGRIYLRASAPLGLAGKIGSTADWAQLFSLCVNAAVEPLLRWVAMQTGEVNLVARTAGPEQRNPEYFKQNAQQFEAALDRALSIEDEVGRAFWIGVGVTLLAGYRKEMSAGVRHRAIRKSKEMPLKADLPFAQLVYGVEPVLVQDRRWITSPPYPSSKSMQVRVGTRPREGGVTGVLHSRRDRDIGDALASSFSVPKRVRTIKLVEEGFMIPHRPPYRRPDRDLLSLTLRTVEVDDLASADLVKAAWVDASQRLRIILNNVAMAKSELGLGHCTEDGCKTSALSIAADPPQRGLNILSLEGALRANLISASALMPDIFEAIAQEFDATPISRSAAQRAAQAVIKACTTRSIRSTETLRRGAARETTIPTEKDYARVSLLEIAPSTVRGEETVVINWRQDRLEMIHRYGLDGALNPYCGTILCPNKLTAGAVFALCSDDTHDSEEIVVPSDEPPMDALAKTIGALSAAIISFNLLAVLNG